jgi:hypothetical protein
MKGLAQKQNWVPPIENFTKRSFSSCFENAKKNLEKS